jgi:uncharacterized protein
MADSNEALVRRGYEAFGSGDMETLGALMADDVVHVIPGNNQFTGAHQGRDNVFALYGQLFELSGGTYQATLKSVEERGANQVVAVHQATGTREGRSLDVLETLTFTIDDGRIVHLESSFDDPDDEAAEDAFWG